MHRGWRRLATLRVRTTLAAAVIVGVALIVGAVGLLLTLRHSLIRNGDDAARTRARDLATLVAADALRPTLTAAGEEDFVQVVTASGAVVASSPNVADRRPIATFVPRGKDPVVRTLTDVRDGQAREAFRVWALRAPSRDGPMTVYVGTSLETVDETVATVRGVLAVGLPPLLGLAGLGAWILLRRALRPVEAIRAEVADISARALDRRVPVPPAEDEIGRLARTMNAMLDRLQAAAERERRFVGDASHELQSPLASFGAQLEVALAHPSGTDWQATAADLLQDSRQMERLVRDLLFLARNDLPLAAPAAPVDLDDIVLDEATRLRSHTRITVDTAGVSAGPVRGSRDELNRLVRNLLENAGRHATTAVRVELAVAGGQVRLVVADDGPGIPAEHRERIFDRFARLDDARTRTDGGTGLGLAIVRDVAGRHGGAVRVEDSQHGARFVVTLPCVLDATAPL